MQCNVKAVNEKKRLVFKKFSKHVVLYLKTSYKIGITILKMNVAGILELGGGSKLLFTFFNKHKQLGMVFNLVCFVSLLFSELLIVDTLSATPYILQLHITQKPTNYFLWMHFDTLIIL